MDPLKSSLIENVMLFIDSDRSIVAYGIRDTSHTTPLSNPSPERPSNTNALLIL